MLRRQASGAADTAAGPGRGPGTPAATTTGAPGRRGTATPPARAAAPVAAHADSDDLGRAGQQRHRDRRRQRRRDRAGDQPGPRPAARQPAVAAGERRVGGGTEHRRRAVAEPPLQRCDLGQRALGIAHPRAGQDRGHLARGPPLQPQQRVRRPRRRP
ncbi:hypothetical protein ACI2LC_24300 [Nonomuraea wenchangensis]|uniref:hypothetical protein n=1 Tax=Nonomuraea wenchangensis TaxID=568860 RepID=UPI00384C3390